MQPSTYGFDNRCTLDAMRCFGESAHAIIVADAATPDEELARLDAAGVRGIRCNLALASGASLDDLTRIGRRLACIGWHARINVRRMRMSERWGALLREAPERVLWGSDWPHPTETITPDAAVHLQLLRNGRLTARRFAACSSTTEPGFTASRLCDRIREKDRVMTSRRAVLSSFLASPVLLSMPRALAQAWPSKNITYVVPYPPGGTTDVLARMIATRLGAALNATVVVENKPGATGAIGTIPSVLIVAANSPFKTVADVIAEAKKKPGSISYASGGNGTILHAAGGTPEALAAYQKAEIAKWGNVISKAGIKLE